MTWEGPGLLGTRLEPWFGLNMPVCPYCNSVPKGVSSTEEIPMNRRNSSEARELHALAQDPSHCCRVPTANCSTYAAKRSGQRGIPWSAATGGCVRSMSVTQPEGTDHQGLGSRKGCMDCRRGGLRVGQGEGHSCGAHPQHTQDCSTCSCPWMPADLGTLGSFRGLFAIKTRGLEDLPFPLSWHLPCGELGPAGATVWFSAQVHRGWQFHLRMSLMKG